ncbi:glutamate synthase large subunit [Corallococcus sp. AB032C]|uniref:glutamate synthase large subunit n=1 Tax=Corallococcus TaxID=83461 RepID=UPI000EC2A912|nr:MULTISPECIES: glutamate synthase large subunit [Corallococcus]NNB86049.1 glutamate synthase large subunit [Corallococcus exiguus]NPC45588.1 glutamate synthase large subunit [Corallococcus exiguus]RKH87119.1 glutamate synthase large subunit [Corallococcus sp. AB032C]
MPFTLPPRYGLYEPETEHDACGVGFVAHIRGQRSRGIVEDALELLNRLSHRAAAGRDPETGDGAGILVQLPHRFFNHEAPRLGFELPPRRQYGVAQVFLPPEPEARRACEALFEDVVEEEGQRLLGWRDVPVAPEELGPLAREAAPFIRQLFIARRRVVPSAFERKLYRIRKLVENRVQARGVDPQGRFHVASCSSETLIYKGLLLPRQLPRFYADLRHPEFVSALALVHSRFSTNTFPTWELAQPFRFIAHNGEINTLRGNRNWMTARRGLLQTAKLGGSLEPLWPIIVPGKSDSAQFDNMVELLYLGGRTLPHAMMMMIPEAWEGHKEMGDERRAFYEYSASLLEPWDGPAAIAFTDGQLIGATLDRNGLRPARYLVTEDDRIILASETGVIDVPPSQVRRKGRLTPGRMLLVDTTEGRILEDEEVKHEITSRWPYRRWLQRNVFTFEDLPAVPAPARLKGETLWRTQRAFGYTDEDVRTTLVPMAETGKEPTGSMGTDTPLAVLSDQAPTLFNYFHQLFAQVTNPPIDPLREALVMTLATALGPEGNTFEETPEQCHRLSLPGPILTNGQLARLANLRGDTGLFEPRPLSLLYPHAGGAATALEVAVERLCSAAVDAVDAGASILVLSDRGVDSAHAAIPALLAVSAVHQRLVRDGTRMYTGIVLETAEAREVHHFACLFAYGVSAVNPYLALDTLRALADAGELKADADKAQAQYLHGLEEGLLKVMSKMGISTLQSYRGSQLFEAVGLQRSLIEKHFTGTSSRVEGVGLPELGREVAERHARGFGAGADGEEDLLPVGGQFRWRRQGERHKWNPATVAKLQAAVRANDATQFQEYSKLADDETREHSNLRGLLDVVTDGCTPVPLEEVEPALELARRFVTGAMSFGSISAEAHETLAIAMNRLGGKSNSGEGGEESRRYTQDPNGDSRRSAIKQVASARFGVTAEYLVNADELQIKMAQGAKPGEGGQLPGHKVDERIARVRWSTPGVTLISPPPHHDIYSIEDLAQLIYDLQSVNAKARVSVKLVSEVGVGTIAAGVAKAGAGCVVVAGYEGGTGASPLSSLQHAGLPWELGLAETQQVLVHNGLRSRIRVQVDGGLRTARDVLVAALLGAEEFGLATASLVSVGCIMLRKCHLNTCSAGIATQDPALRERYQGTPENVVSFFLLLAEDLRLHMAKLGVRKLEELVGRVDLLRQRAAVDHWKARKVDLSALLTAPSAPATEPRHCQTPHRKDVADHLDHELLTKAQSVLAGGPPLMLTLPVANTHRAVGAMLSGEIARRHGAQGLPDGKLRVKLKGSAGQSFGAFLASGVTLELEGDTNDYLGKGLSGGRIIVYPPEGSRFTPEENVLVGNTVLYGATAGEVYLRGLAGERFAVRNSGAQAVVEGVGDHGCEYMTGGVVVVLGQTGRNFAAGMSGGTAYVLDRERTFRERCNLEMVELESLVDESEIWLVHGMIERHLHHTGSALARRVLDNWELMVPQFMKVMPSDYKRVLQARRAARRPPPAAGVQQLHVVGGGA